MINKDGIMWTLCCDRLPHDGVLVMVTGKSGYITHKKFLALAYVDGKYGAKRWHDVTGTLLSENGWAPDFWAKAFDLPGGA